MMDKILESQTQIGSYSIHLFEKASNTVSGDDYLVLPLPGFLRLAVFDGVTETKSTVKPFSQTGDSFAAGVLRTAYKTEDDPVKVAEKANKYLHSFSGKRARDIPQATAMIADIYPDRIHFLRSGDCEAWVKRNGYFTPVFTEGMLTKASEENLLSWRTENPKAGSEESFSAEEKYLGNSKDWNSTPIGRFKEAKLQTASLDNNWDEIVLASDGAHLNEEVVQDLSYWKEWVLEQTLSTHYKKKDDIVLLHIKKQTGKK